VVLRLRRVRQKVAEARAVLQVQAACEGRWRCRARVEAPARNWDGSGQIGTDAGAESISGMW
jgi:hypothetical protein